MASGNLRILAISLNRQSFFDEAYSPLLTALRAKADFQRVEDAISAIQLLSQRSQSQPQPLAVLLTDDALSLAKNARVWEAVLGYIHRGGTAVVMGHFPCFVKPNNMKPFFSKAGLDWGSGSYHRTTLILNRATVDQDVAAKLPLSYSQKAVFVNNVASADMWYRTNQDSVVESRVFAPTNANVPGETAVALARIGDGKLGYVGDVNAEEESDAVVLAMCGLL